MATRTKPAPKKQTRTKTGTKPKASPKARPARAAAAKAEIYRGGPMLPFRDGAAWSAWLAANHESPAGVWIKLAKKGSGVPSVAYPEVLDIALAWGWIDAVRHPLDETWFLQRFTRRNPRSKWSQINRAKALAMIADGRMKPPGLAEVERARADGRWDAAYESQRNATVPDDLAAALDARRGARAFFDKLDSRNRYAVLFRIRDAKKPETRARRIAQFADMLARGERLHP